MPSEKQKISSDKGHDQSGNPIQTENTAVGAVAIPGGTSSANKGRRLGRKDPNCSSSATPNPMNTAGSVDSLSLNAKPAPGVLRVSGSDREEACHKLGARKLTESYGSPPALQATVTLQRISQIRGSRGLRREEHSEIVAPPTQAGEILAEKQRIAFRGSTQPTTSTDAETAEFGLSRIVDVDVDGIPQILPHDDEQDVEEATEPTESDPVGLSQEPDIEYNSTSQSELISAHVVDDEAIENRIIQNTEAIRNQLIEEAAVATEVKKETCWKKYRIACGLISVFCIVLAIVLGVTIPNDDDAPLTGYDYLVELISPISGEAELMDETSPQYKTMSWLAFDDEAKISLESSQASILLDRYVIALLYFAMGGSGWLNQLNFLSNSSVCEWPPISVDAADETNQLVGIRCGNDGLVNHIRLDFNNLTGTTVEELSAIKTLGLLSFQGNDLTGRLPASLGNLPRLELLAFPQNSISGTIPDSYANLETVKTLVLFENSLSGTIPENLTKIDMERLFLSDNGLTGTIPEVLTRSAMRILALQRNNLEGTIPESIFTLNGLEELVLVSNRLTGTLSTRFGLLTSLSRLELFDNCFNLTIPTELGKLTKLTALRLFENELRGEIPSELGSLHDLLSLELSRNSLTGTIPESFGGLSNLFQLFLYENKLTGTIPSVLSNLVELSYGTISLHNNSFAGSVDPIFCNESIFLPPASLTADCNELACSCCSDCCNDATGECTVAVDVICRGTARDFEFWGEGVGTECSCLVDLDEGVDLSCADTECQVCSSDGGGGGDSSSVCLQSVDYGYDYTEDGSDHLWRCTMQFVTGGREERISYTEDAFLLECSVTVDDVSVCNSCDIQICSDGFRGVSVDCSNIEEGAVYDDCDATLNGGDLLWFMAPEYFETDCFPCLYGW